jgi:hypothetical protein
VEIIVVERRHDEGVVGRTPTLRDSDKHHDVMRFSCRRVYLEDVSEGARTAMWQAQTDGRDD